MTFITSANRNMSHLPTIILLLLLRNDLSQHNGLKCIHTTTTIILCRYIITCTDYFTKWAEAAPLPTKEANGVANFLYSMFCRHGVPKRIQSDQGREFVNSLNQHLFQLTGVQHIISTAYHPQTNGLDE